MEWWGADGTWFILSHGGTCFSEFVVKYRGFNFFFVMFMLRYL